VSGRLQATGPGEYFWRGRIAADVDTSCRRCLADVVHHVDQELGVLLSDDPDAADDPAVYVLPPAATTVDLRGIVREELVLAVPLFLLCRDDCAGLCPRCGADLNAGRFRSDAPPSRRSGSAAVTTVARACDLRPVPGADRPSYRIAYAIPAGTIVARS
jgi:uncharacterized protein